MSIPGMLGTGTSISTRTNLDSMQQDVFLTDSICPVVRAHHHHNGVAP